MVIMSVDYGDSRTGIAACDKLQFLASPVSVIKEPFQPKLIQRIIELAKERKAEKFVVGLPLNMDGSEGPRADVVRAFVDLLKAETDLPIFYEDERMTTMEANRFLSATETFGKKRKEKVDALSAELILQSWLDRKRREEKADEAKSG